MRSQSQYGQGVPTRVRNGSRLRAHACVRVGIAQVISVSMCAMTVNTAQAVAWVCGWVGCAGHTASPTRRVECPYGCRLSLSSTLAFGGVNRPAEDGALVMACCFAVIMGGGGQSRVGRVHGGSCMHACMHELRSVAAPNDP